MPFLRTAVAASLHIHYYSTVRLGPEDLGPNPTFFPPVSVPLVGKLNVTVKLVIPRAWLSRTFSKMDDKNLDLDFSLKPASIAKSKDDYVIRHYVDKFQMKLNIQCWCCNDVTHLDMK